MINYQFTNELLIFEFYKKESENYFRPILPTTPTYVKLTINSGVKLN